MFSRDKIFDENRKDILDTPIYPKVQSLTSSNASKIESYSSFIIYLFLSATSDAQDISEIF